MSSVTTVGNMTVDVYDGRCALKIIASQIRKSRAHTPSRTSHMPLAHRIHLLFIAQKPRFALGGVFRLGLDRSRSRGSTVMVFILFRGGFEAVFLPFCSSEGPRDYPRPAIQSLPSVSGSPEPAGGTVTEACASSKDTTVVLVSDTLR